jgi:hypothetical protein
MLLELKKLPDELGDDELEEALKRTESSNTIHDAGNDVVNFLISFKIKPGIHRIKDKLLYQLYRTWTKEEYITAYQFNLQCGKYLKRRQSGKNFYYTISKSNFKLTEEANKYLEQFVTNKTKSPRYKLHFDNFLRNHNIKAGLYFVQSYVLYYLYDIWTYSIKKHNPLGEIQFFNFCKLYFKQRRIGSNRVAWFGISKSIKDVVNEETFKKAEAWGQGKEQKKKAKSKQKKSDKVSSLETTSKSQD